MIDQLKAYFTELVSLVNEMAPYLLLGFFFAGLLKVAIPQRTVVRFMGGNNLRSVVNASLLGIPMPLCSCGVLPAGIGFYRNGASRGASISFLVSTPQTGVDSILATYGLLGWPLAVIRPLIALLSGVSGGLLGNSLKEDLDQERQEEDRNNGNGRGGIRTLFQYGFVELLRDLATWLIVGMLFAALLAVLIPDDFFTRYIHNEYLEMGVMLLASVPLYVCATGSIPIAAVLLLKGLSPGAALVLLMAGPATNVATMTVIGKAMGRRSLGVYLISIIGGALFFGILINELLPREWIMGSIPGAGLHALHHEGVSWIKWFSSAVLVILIINGYLTSFLERRKNKSREGESFEGKLAFEDYLVEGMTCSQCKSGVENVVIKIPGVEEAVADPGKNLLSIRGGSIEEETLRSEIESLGYTFKGRVFRL